MQLTPNEDQTQILNFLDGLCKPFANVPMHDHSFALTSAELDGQLEESGFLDVMTDPALGAVTAALIVERLARLPFAVESANSALVRPLLDPALARPLCLVEEGQLRKPVRFLQPGASVVMVGHSRVSTFTVSDAQIRGPGEEVLYAYPVAFLTDVPASANLQLHEIGADEVRRCWRIALAAEGAGLLAAALNSVVTHVSDRKQFARPLAAFQALRHRLAEAKVWTNGCYWLAIKAAASGDAGDAALAALHVQDAIKRVTYDCHQFLGAMGMTLEHPLHLWTYRLKALSSELGGGGRQALAAADAIWPE
jgi:hypothetical protein